MIAFVFIQFIRIMKMTSTVKFAFSSKTIWFSLLTLALAIAAYFGFESFAMPPELKEWYDLLLPVVFLGLRFLTKEKISLKKQQPAPKQD